MISTTEVVVIPPIAAAVPAARALEARARQDGYAIGFPTRLTEEARAADLAACRRLRCPGCGGRGMEARPYHRPPTMLNPAGGYRLVCCCAKCGAGEVI